MGATNQPSAHIAIATSCVSTMAHNRGAAGNGGMKNPRWVRVTNSRRVPNRPKNIGRFRSDGDDPEGADSKDRRNAISEDRRSSLPRFSIPPHKGDRIQFIPVLPSSAIVFATEPANALYEAVGRLSGGNQQRILLGRSLEARPRVLLLNDFTRGVDVKAKAGIHALVRKLAEAGIAICVTSSDLEELLGVADRIVCMRAGRIVADRPSSDFDKLS